MYQQPLDPEKIERTRQILRVQGKEPPSLETKCAEDRFGQLWLRALNQWERDTKDVPEGEVLPIAEAIRTQWPQNLLFLAQKIASREYDFDFARRTIYRRIQLENGADPVKIQLEAEQDYLATKQCHQPFVPKEGAAAPVVTPPPVDDDEPLIFGGDCEGAMERDTAEAETSGGMESTPPPPRLSATAEAVIARQAELFEAKLRARKAKLEAAKLKKKH